MVFYYSSFLPAEKKLYLDYLIADCLIVDLLIRVFAERTHTQINK